ncbi:hypothetical protein AWR36_005385 [Microbulbifer flavimaris]|uniref:Lipoprotein n=1 Tax=Microbulbifer flavimaris TaxID=1781068 RepID=A0ABX4HZQ5_9GAMM|nr:MULTISPECIES: DUF6279 family lipoprotein [Microbulbifer]KUJ83306.1 hypothetical protein AVO43_05375 [Microbulbifer sp. ZGT114]PCO05458.1 hypothetical protein AWR36_005385 [Microbulbifer flavimaris]
MATQTVTGTTAFTASLTGRAARLLLALFCLLALTSCSSIQFAYNQLDTWLRWQLNDYVDLNRNQKDQLASSLESFHIWHRQTQLPRYAEFLEQLAYEASNGDLEEVSLPALEDDINQFWDTTSGQLYQQLLPLTAQLTPAQIDELEQALLEKRMESLEKWQTSPEKVRERRNKRIRKQSRRWLGSINERQEQLIGAFVHQVAYNPLIRDQQRQIWQARFISLLREKPPGYQDKLLDLMHNPEQLWSEDYRRMQDERRKQAMQLSRELLASTTPAQRRHLTETLRDYAVDFRTLAQR